MQILILGIVQGVTEFLPISSSGHLSFFQHVMRFREPELLLYVALHGGTLGAVLIVFREDLVEIARGLLREQRATDAGLEPSSQNALIYVLLGTVVTGILGMAFHDTFEALYASIGPLGPCWLFTGTVLWITRAVPQGQKRSMGPWDAILVGFVQFLALAPGVSRSGMTIATGLLLRWDRKWAATFSFLLSIPATLGALIVEAWRGEIRSVGLGLLLLGGLISLLVGWLSLRWLIQIVLRGQLHRFAWYCWLMGGAVGMIWIISKIA